MNAWKGGGVGELWFGVACFLVSPVTWTDWPESVCAPVGRTIAGARFGVLASALLTGSARVQWWVWRRSARRLIRRRVMVGRRLLGVMVGWVGLGWVGRPSLSFIVSCWFESGRRVCSCLC